MFALCGLRVIMELCIFLHPPGADEQRVSSSRAERLCASCAWVRAGVWALRPLPPPLRPLGALWPPPPPPAASFHKSPGAQPVPAFQAGPAPAAAVPEHQASSPNPHLRRSARRGVECRGGRLERGGGCQLSARTCRSPESGSPSLSPEFWPPPPGRDRTREAASPVGKE
ncbi:uncharacterized protein LOC128313899 [Acinonyx jubatus]|uniref:Uncharacterized protein LOC128313899 n=1 Tax=Acinonyx jubatus TaxID=32536 RepID=A0ABM3PF20_ACIJB|nr:uncharacterized protein LOC128313899 [Acinonyx jubatus]